MTHAYATLTTLKTRLTISATTDDTTLRLLLESVSRVVDKWCRRHFYALSATRYEDGTSGRLFLSDDLLSVTTLKTDEDGNGVYENTFLAADYLLYPLNGYPKLAVDLSHDSGYSHFANGVRKGVEIAGLWGYGDGDSATPYGPAGVTATATDGTTTSVTVSAAGDLAAGHTILVESEQMYITAIVSTTLTVIRAQNGTTGAAHSAKAVSIYQYPDAIREATLMTAARLWRRKDSAFATIIGGPEMGPMEIWQGLDPDVQLLMSPFVNTLRGFA